MDTVRIVSFIETTLKRKGNGTPDDPTRVITQYWNLDGTLAIELDPHYRKGRE